MILQFDLAGGVNRFGRFPIIFQGGVVDHQLIVQKDMDLAARHQNAETIPLADRIVRKSERVPRILFVVP